MIFKLWKFEKDGHIFHLLNTFEANDVPIEQGMVKTAIFKGVRYTPMPDGSLNCLEFVYTNMGFNLENTAYKDSLNEMHGLGIIHEN